MGPFPLPGHPLGLGHVHPRLPVPAVDGGQGDRRRRLDLALRAGDGRRARDRPAHPVRTAGRRGGVVVGAAAVVRSRRAPKTARPSTGAAPSCTSAPATTATTTATRPPSPACRRSPGRSCTRRRGRTDLDVAGRNVVVVGSGATAVTLVPALAERGAHVTMLQRSPTWMISLPGTDSLADALRRRLPRTARPRRGPVEEHPLHAGLLPGLPARAERREADAAGGPRARAARPGGRRHRLRPHLRPVGPAAVRRARRRLLPRDEERCGRGRDRPDRHRHAHRRHVLVGPGVARRRARHRHRAACCRRGAASR